MTKEECEKFCDALRNTHPSRMMCKDAADEIERLSFENDWLRTALRAAQIGLAQSGAELDDDKPLGFRTNDVPDPYAEGPQSDAEPVAWRYSKGGSVWFYTDEPHVAQKWREAEWKTEPLYPRPPRPDTSAGLVESAEISEQVWQALCARADASAGLIEAAEINYILTTLKHARVFITSREKMHPTGVELYDELIEKLRARAADRSGK
jgi:hypothetical protein